MGHDEEPIYNYTEWRKQEPQSSRLDALALSLLDHIAPVPPWGATWPTTQCVVIWEAAS